MITPISSVTQFSEKDMNLVTKLTHEQEAYANAILNNHITFVDAKAGTAKTTTSVQVGLALLGRGIVKKVVYVANPVQTEALGHLKGTLVDKTIHYYMPFFDAIYKAGVSKLKYPMEDVADPTVSTDLEATTPVFMRGITIENSFIIIDEAQNFSIDDLRKIGTRITDDCILVVIGHNGQIDVKASASGFSYYMNHFKKLKEHGEFKKVAFCELTHNFRGSISKAFDNI